MADIIQLFLQSASLFKSMQALSELRPPAYLPSNGRFAALRHTGFLLPVADV